MDDKKSKNTSDKMSVVEKAKDVLVARQQAYQQTFGGGSLFIKKVMEDLARFCRANESTFHADPRIHAVLEGRREVYLRIKQHLEMDPSELEKLYLKEI